MKVIVCLDDADGMLFNKRRQSKDKVLREFLLSKLGEQKLWMNEYSKRQFEEEDARISVSEDYLALAEDDDFCFVETDDVSPYEDKITALIIVHWNRKYPADMYFDIDYQSDAWELVSSEELVGNSHPDILIEEYTKKADVEQEQMEEQTES